MEYGLSTTLCPQTRESSEGVVAILESMNRPAKVGTCCSTPKIHLDTSLVPFEAPDEKVVDPYSVSVDLMCCDRREFSSRR